MSKGTILIVEDQQGFRRIYHDVLESDGYQVLEAADGEAGWQAAKEKKPNLILLDLGLPKIDGFEVLKRIRADAETKSIPVIIFSVLGEQKDINRGLELGANDYTVKGFYTPRQILSKIKSLITQVDQKPMAQSYKIRLDESADDAVRLQEEIGLTNGYRCSQCQTGMVLELFPDFMRGEGHWFTTHLICPKCGRTF
jgi:DNA-binding response OmpR family regulator